MIAVVFRKRLMAAQQAYLRSVHPKPRNAMQVARCAGEGWVRLAVKLKSLVQLCVQVGAVSEAHQLPSPRWRGESITLRRETGHQTSGCKGEKGISASRRRRRPKRVTMGRMFDEGTQASSVRTCQSE